jgi:hypothetical protein
MGYLPGRQEMFLWRWGFVESSHSSGILQLLSSLVEQLAQSHGVFGLVVNQKREITLVESSTTFLDAH